jgi:hypothetical protein
MKPSLVAGSLLALLLTAGCGPEPVPDGGLDAGTSDGGLADAGPVDAGPQDAGPLSLELSFGELDPPFEPEVQDYVLSAFTRQAAPTLTVRGAQRAIYLTQTRANGVPAPVTLGAFDDTAVLRVNIDGRVYSVDLKPQGFPDYEVTSSGATPGHLHIPSGPYLLIFDMATGGLLAWRNLGGGGAQVIDFRRWDLPGGLTRFTYLRNGSAFVLDEALRPLRTHQMVVTARNPSPSTGRHDLQLLGDNHIILQSFVTKRVQNVPAWLNPADGGANVEAPYVQEQRDGGLVWELDGSEFPELYALSRSGNSFAQVMPPQNYAHNNAFRYDVDAGTMVMSFRNLDTILHVDVRGQRILWRLGGELPDGGFPDSFATPVAQRPVRQHTAYLEAPNVLSVFDNRDGGPSRLTTYTLDPDAGRIVNFRELDLGFSVIQQGSSQPLSPTRVVVGLGTHSRDPLPDGGFLPDVLELDRSSGTAFFRLRFLGLNNAYRAWWAPPR